MVFTLCLRSAADSRCGLVLAYQLRSQLAPEIFRVSEGARVVDEHFVNQDGLSNIPLLTALIGVWNYNFLHCQSLAILCYDQRLRLLPPYLQQLFMSATENR